MPNTSDEIAEDIPSPRKNQQNASEWGVGEKGGTTLRNCKRSKKVDHDFKGEGDLRPL